MIKRLCIVIGLVLSMSVLAMTVEQEQRFLYYFYEAERLWDAKQYADAFALFDYCHTLNPDDAITNRYLGHVYRGCEQMQQALYCYKKAWEKAPQECWKDYAIPLYNLADDAKKAEAIRVMEQTSKQLPKETDLWEHLRDAYIGTRNYKKALLAQDQVDQLEGYDAYSAINRYRIYLLMLKPQKAIQAIEKYLEEDPTNLQFQLYRMQLYESTGQSAQKLIPIYQQILRLDPFNALVLNNYAYLLSIQKGDLKQAEKMSTKAVQAEPQNPVFLDTYAWILYLSGQKDLAKIYIRQAVDLYQNKDLPHEIQKHYNTIYSK